MKSLLAITMGDVNGVGPEIIAKSLASGLLQQICRPVVIGSANAYRQARACARDAPQPIVIDSIDDLGTANEEIAFLDTAAGDPDYRPGTLDAEAGRCAMIWIERAVELALAGTIDGLVTCPINKEGIHRAGFAFRGHTDFIANLTGTDDYRMCLFAGPMRVVHISDHVSLRSALDLVTTENIETSIRIGNAALERLRVKQRRIAVAALNPHAGEAGAFGEEETTIISPAIARCRSEGIECSGPYAADTLFGRMNAGDFEMVIALYHDQGHIPLKLMSMDEGVNVTLGLPIVRTSVGHGTAYDIAGQGIAREHSLVNAARLAAQLVERS